MLWLNFEYISYKIYQNEHSNLDKCPQSLTNVHTKLNCENKKKLTFYFTIFGFKICPNNKSIASSLEITEQTNNILFIF